MVRFARIAFLQAAAVQRETFVRHQTGSSAGLELHRSERLGRAFPFKRRIRRAAAGRRRLVQTPVLAKLEHTNPIHAAKPRYTVRILFKWRWRWHVIAEFDVQYADQRKTAQPIISRRYCGRRLPGVAARKDRPGFSSIASQRSAAITIAPIRTTRRLVEEG